MANNGKHYTPNVVNTEAVLNALLDGKVLTVRTVLDDLGILYLPQIIHHLRQRGIEIQTQYHRATRSDGRTIEYAQYSMAEGDIIAFKVGV